ncbi:MAG: hypothetical protein CVV64_06220 [Candidatus Wallbacteria bacterium HGW-Wallbacteria-1]|jgi:hypothetical protein|uniref:SbsA Ig-like domain-containing protein n=1 Tax=Candidatus Wallbacteria bacterium HGW-Wallbacteria-1 TaxID=2013854 RepID=A0A2N1PSQ7_9BACT|nr:MAG: hypothetical protein CVV64_06220 [Candidatus Wallbacteria bacterium HGW-Wallbacteria-1]
MKPDTVFFSTERLKNGLALTVLFILTSLICLSIPANLHAKTRATAITLIRPDRVRLHFSSAVNAASAIDRTGYRISGNSAIQSVVSLPPGAAETESVELRISGLAEGSIYSVAVASMSCPDGTTTEAVSLTLSTQPLAINRGSWGKPGILSLSSGIFHTPAIVSADNSILVSAVQGQSSTDIAGIVIFHSPDQGSTFSQKSIGYGSQTAHSSTYDPLYPDLAGAPLLNPGPQLAADNGKIVLVWTSIYFNEGRLHIAVSEDGGATWPDSGYVTVNLGQDTVAHTPSVTIEQDLIAVLLTKASMRTDISSNRYTDARTIELLRISRLDSPSAAGKNYAMVSQETLLQGNALTSWPANPQPLIKDRSLHIAYTTFNSTSRTCSAMYGRYDFDDARGKFRVTLPFKELAPYHSLTTGPRLTWCNNTLIAAMVTVDQYDKSYLITSKSLDGGAFFSDPSPIAPVLLDFIPWEQSPVYTEIFSLFSGILTPGELPRPLLVYKDLRPSPDYAGRTLHRTLLIRGLTDCSFRNEPENLGLPSQGTYYEATTRGAALCINGTKLTSVYLSGEIFQESAATGYSRIHLRQEDATPPRLLSAMVKTQTTLELIFDEPVDPVRAAVISCYSFGEGGVLIHSAIPSESGTTVTLTTSPFLAGSILTVTLNGITDRAGNLIAPRNGQYTFTVPESTEPASGWSPPVRLSQDPADSLTPVTAISGDEIYVAWSDTRDDSSWSGRPNSEIYSRRSLNRGASWEPVLRLTNSLEESARPAASSSATGSVLAWQDFRDKNHEIYLGWFSPGGGTWSGDIRLTRDTNLSTWPTVVQKGENIYVAWADSADGDNDIYISYSHDMGLTWAPMVKATDNSSDSIKPALAMTPSGNLVLVWEDDQQLNRAVYAKVWSENPLEITDSQPISGSLTSTGPVVACDDMGRVVAAWTAAVDSTRTQFHYSTSLDGGIHFTAPINLSSHAGTTSGISIASSGSTIYTAYGDDREGLQDIYMATTTDGGSHFTSGFRVSPTLPQDPACNSTTPSIALWNNLAAISFERDLYGKKEIYLTTNSGLIPRAPAISVASFANPADSRETFALVKSSDPLEAAPAVTAVLPDLTAVTLEVSAVRDLLWLARYRGNGSSFGLTRITAAGRDLFGNMGSGVSSLISAKVSASGKVDIPDPRFHYILNDVFVGTDVTVNLSAAAAMESQGSSKKAASAVIGEDLTPITPCFTCYTSNQPTADVAAGKLFCTASAESLISSAELALKRDVQFRTLGIYSISDGVIKYVNQYISGQSQEVRFGEALFLAADHRAPQISEARIGTLAANEGIIFSFRASDAASGVNRESITISTDNSTIRVNSDMVKFDGDVITVALTDSFSPNTGMNKGQSNEFFINVKDNAGNMASAKVVATNSSSGGIRLFCGWPNPADRLMTLRFDSGLPLDMDLARVKIFDFSGQWIRTIQGSDFTLIPLTAGVSRYEAPWNLTDSSDEPVANGTYFLRLEYQGAGGGKFNFKAAVLR